jgi:hypothetical protein
MSLINDALKRAKQAPPRNTPNALPPLRPAAEEPSSVPVWLIPSVIIILIFAAIFFIGWSVAHNAVRNIVTAPDAAATQEVAVVPVPVVAPHPEPPAPVNPPDLPALQGIFYSPTMPSAIVDGKTIRPGDHFKQYRVKEITKYTVTLIDQDGKPVKLGMGN